MADISAIKLPDEVTYDLKDKKRGSVFFGQVENTSTSTAFTAQIDGITEYYDGLAVMLKNGVVTSAANFTININGLGAKHAYSNMAAATAETTLFNANYTMLFVYDSTRVEGGGWILYRGYNSNDNTIGYQIRSNSMSLPMTSVVYRYRLLFTSADGEHFVPANNSTSTNATASRTVCQDPIDPFGRIVYYSGTASVAAGSRPGATALWDRYTIALGYSFNRTGAALTMTSWKPVYVKCAPQTDGSAIIDSTTPFVQDLPTTADGKIYIMLGVAYSATNIELFLEHPVYYFIDGSIRLWTNPRETSVTETDPVFTSSAAYGISSSDISTWNGKSDFSGSYNDLTNKPTIPTVNNATLTIQKNGSDVKSFTANASSDVTANITVPTKTSDLTNDSGFITGYTETDPTVPSWAKQSTKPTYTASEVGALPSTTQIPSKTSDLTNDSDFVSYGDEGQIDTYLEATADYDWDTDTPDNNPASAQYASLFRINNSNGNIVTHIDTHKYTHGATYSIFGTTRKISGTDHYNQIGLGINDDGSCEYSISDKAKFRRAFGGVPFAHFESNNSIAVANSNISSTQTFQAASQFTSAVQSHIIGDSDFFDTDTNGLKVLKHGYYQVLATVHLHGVAQSCWGMRIRNYTDNNNVGTERFGYTPAGYASISFSTIAEIGANKIIIPQIERYSTVTANSKWRPANITFDLILLKDI